ncbi:hypotheticall protein [Colletotrichum viniferum]|nr:hypotheticall protein [Colletotrichum viniferum]
MSDIQKNVEAASESYSSGFTKGHLALPPAKKYLVLTCMDARIDPARAFGIELGDAHVIRNNEDAYALVDQNLGAGASAELKSRSLDFLPFSDLEEAVKKDIDYIKGTELVPQSVALSGWIYEVETGKTKRVV